MLYQTLFYPVFLPGALLVYWLICKTEQQRVFCIGILSFLFLCVADVSGNTFSFAVPSLIGLTLQSFVVFILGKRLHTDPGKLKLSLTFVVPLSVYFIFKFILPAAAHFGAVQHILIPMGISYYTLKHVHYLVESSRGKFVNDTFISYFTYIFFFPMFTAGPIERYTNFSKEIQDIQFNSADFSRGLERILTGMIRKFVVADLLLEAFMPPSDYLIRHIDTMPWSVAFLICFVKFLRVYFDFSGYADMAIGTGLLFGIKIMENFNFPLLRSNLAEFWRNWHISLSEWARDYIYFPVLIKYRITGAALVATMVVIGLWHGLKPGWLLWGMHHGIGLTLLSYFHRWAKNQQAVQRIRNSTVWRILGLMTVWWYVSMGYALTYFPGNMLKISLKLYIKIMTWGLVA